MLQVLFFHQFYSAVGSSIISAPLFGSFIISALQVHQLLLVCWSSVSQTCQNKCHPVDIPCQAFATQRAADHIAPAIRVTLRRITEAICWCTFWNLYPKISISVQKSEIVNFLGSCAHASATPTLSQAQDSWLNFIQKFIQSLSHAWGRLCPELLHKWTSLEVRVLLGHGSALSKSSSKVNLTHGDAFVRSFSRGELH